MITSEITLPLGVGRFLTSKIRKIHDVFLLIKIFKLYFNNND